MTLLIPPGMFFFWHKLIKVFILWQGISRVLVPRDQSTKSGFVRRSCGRDFDSNPFSGRYNPLVRVTKDFMLMFPPQFSVNFRPCVHFSA
jgi:hypothetical protein